MFYDSDGGSDSCNVHIKATTMKLEKLREVKAKVRVTIVKNSDSAYSNDGYGDVRKTVTLRKTLVKMRVTLVKGPVTGQILTL